VAEIPIRRKEGRNIWPLLIGLVALAAVLWYVFARPSTPNTSAGRADSAAVTRDSAAGAATTPPPTTSTPRTDSTGRP